MSGVDTLKGVYLKRLPVAATTSRLIDAFVDALPVSLMAKFLLPPQRPES